MSLPLSALVLYAIGWLAAIRPAMRRRMLQKLCVGCAREESYGHPYQCQYAYHERYMPRGAMYERTGGDVAWAIFAAAWWPTHLLWTIAVRLVQLFGAGVKRAVDYVSPLTAPELERRLSEQAAEIERLTRQIGG